MDKKKLFVIMALVVVLAILGTGTLAYFTTRAVAHNVVTSGGVQIALMEEFPGAEKKPNGEAVKDGVMPGQEHAKTVWIENRDEPAYIRVKVEVTCGGKSVDPKLLDIDYNLGQGKDQWTRGEDNIYYYNRILEAPDGTKRDQTTPLFTKVVFSAKEMGNQYQDTEFSVKVKAQAVQAKNNPIPDGGKVTDIKGWPEF